MGRWKSPIENWRKFLQRLLAVVENIWHTDLLKLLGPTTPLGRPPLDSLPLRWSMGRRPYCLLNWRTIPWDDNLVRLGSQFNITGKDSPTQWSR